MSKPLVTLSMIVKNEEQYLENCLDSVKNIVDEIVIVDTGSTDRTLEIAKKFNAKVYHFNWVNDFSAARNFALVNSSGEWILYLDADERLNPNSIKELKKIINSGEKLGVNCVVTNLDDYSGNIKKMQYVRLFKNSKEIKFTGKAHEQIIPSLLKNNYQITGSGIEIIHDGYNLPRNELKLKAKRNLPLLIEEYNSSHNSYYAYQLANTYLLLDDIKNANRYYEIALKDKGLDKDYKVISLINLADSYRRRGDLQKAKQFITKGLSINPLNVNLNLVASQIFNGMNLKTEAIKFCKRALKENMNPQKKSQSTLTILVDNNKILYQGILLTFTANDKSGLQYFMENFEKLNKDNPTEVKILKSLINDNLDHENIELLKTVISEENLECYLTLINSSHNINVKLDVLTSIYSMFKDNSRFLVNFGAVLIEANFLEEGARILEESLDKEDKDPTAIFYLASIYLRLKQIIKLNSLVAKSEKLFSSNKLVIEKIKILKAKLHPFLNEPLSAN